eukprot:7642220-Pyramimonas_sp.AAC.1
MSKVALLEVQFSHAGIGLIGIQEGRSRSEQVRAGTFYTMYCAAAGAKGCYGTQLWVSYDVEFRLEAWAAPRSRIAIAAGTIAADEGRERVSLLAVAAHAPHSHDSPEHRQ